MPLNSQKYTQALGARPSWVERRPALACRNIPSQSAELDSRAGLGIGSFFLPKAVGGPVIDLGAQRRARTAARSAATATMPSTASKRSKSPGTLPAAEPRASSVSARTPITETFDGARIGSPSRRHVGRPKLCPRRRPKAARLRSRRTGHCHIPIRGTSPFCQRHA